MNTMKELTKKDRKTIERLFKQYTPEELADAFVFPSAPPATEEERQTEEYFWAERRKQFANRTPEEKKYGKILQIKYQILSRIEDSNYEPHWDFGYFLNEYIRAQDKKDKQFAEDVNVKPEVLSQYLNGHRNPPEKFLIRLELHSNGLIPALWWFRLLQKSKEGDLVQNATMREEERKHVKNKIELAL